MKRCIIAEVGSVHDGSFGNAGKLIDAAAACGADAVKFQTHIAEAETLADAPSPSYFRAEPRQAYFRRTGFTEDQWRGLADRAASRGMMFLSSPFSLEAVDLLESIGVPLYKVPSGEITNLPLLERLAETGKPVLLSSGMSSWDELDAAVRVFAAAGPLTILQCSSVYPCPPERVGLNVMLEMRARYGVPVGYSDHTMGAAAPLAAAALGASVIEKHFAFSRLDVRERCAAQHGTAGVRAVVSRPARRLGHARSPRGQERSLRVRGHEANLREEHRNGAPPVDGHRADA